MAALALPHVLAAGATHGISRPWLGQLLSTDRARFRHNRCHSLGSAQVLPASLRTSRTKGVHFSNEGLPSVPGGRGECGYASTNTLLHMELRRETIVGVSPGRGIPEEK